MRASSSTSRILIRLLKVPGEGQPVSMFGAAELRRDEREQLRAQARLLLRAAVGVEGRVVVPPVDVAPDAVADGAADEHVAQEVPAPRGARKAYGRSQAVDAEAQERSVLPVLVSHDRSERPGADGV